MQGSKKQLLYWRKRPSHSVLSLLISACLMVMALSQGALAYNRAQIQWHDKQVTNVTADGASGLIIATDAKKSKAGAMNYQGEVVIPFENSIFDPWTGSVIEQGLYHEGKLFWVVNQRKVGIVNEENKEVIPQEYGYLKRGYENQFIAGTGTISEAAEDGGQYIHKKYGVVAEGNAVLIPLEYDEMRLSDDGTYYGIIQENTRIIRRSFRKDGTVKAETIQEVKEEESEPEETEEGAEAQTDEPQEGEMETQTEAGGAEETKAEETKAEASESPEAGGNAPREASDRETESGSEGGSGSGSDSGSEGESKTEPESGESSTEGEAPTASKTDIQKYEGGSDTVEILDKYNDRQDRTIHYHAGVTTLELTGQGTVLAEFPGERIPDVNEPVFSEDGKLVLDNWEGVYSVYSARSGQLLCSVSSQTDYIYDRGYLAYIREGSYEVKNLENQLLFTVKAGEADAFLNSVEERPRFVFQSSYFVYQGDKGRTLVTSEGVVIAEELDTIYYSYENEGGEENALNVFICERDGKFGAFSSKGEKLLDFLYKNVEFFTGHVPALRVTDEKGQVGIVDYHGDLIIPMEYDNIGYGTSLQGGDSQLIESYTLLSKGEGKNRYFGQRGNEIYYLDDKGKIVGLVQYVARQEQSGGGLSDVLAFKKQPENRVVYRTTGNQKVMSNAFGTGWTYKRCQIESQLNSQGITFLCIDTLGGQIGVYDYRYGAFTLMGFQQNLYDIWLASSRLFGILAVGYLCSGIHLGKLSLKWGKKDARRKQR